MDRQAWQRASLPTGRAGAATLLLCMLLTGCGVVSGTVATVGAAASVAATAVSVTGTVVKTSVNVGGAVAEKALATKSDAAATQAGH